MYRMNNRGPKIKQITLDGLHWRASLIAGGKKSSF